MLKSILKASICVVCWAGAGFACATGLGGINVTSSLGQPLRAEIEITSIARSDKATLRAKLASAKAYERAGVDYPYGIPKLKFQIVDRKDGRSYIKVTSYKPVNDPFVTLMIELTWSSGQLLREYTFLLDPVGYKPLQPEVADVKPIEPVIAEPVLMPMAQPIPEPEPVQPVVAEPVAEMPEVAAASAVAPAAEAVAASAVVAESAPSAEAKGQLEEEAISAEAMPELEDALSKEEALAESDLEEAPEEITVIRGDTLTKIAAQIKPDDVSLERMLVALYRENAGVFDGHNMNRIQAGKILRVPKMEAARMLPQADAVEEIRVQAADWNVYRQKLAAKLAARAERTYKQEATGKISAAVIDKAFADKKPATEVLKLSKGEAPDDKMVGSGKSSAEEKAIAKEEESIAKSKALKDAQERTAILEKSIQDMKRLEELKKTPVSASAPAPASAIAMNAASAPQPASSVVPAKTEPKPKPKAVPKVIEEPSLIDQLLADPLYLAGGAALLLALGGLGFVAARRGKGGGKKKGLFGRNDVGSTTGRIAAPIAPSPETGDFTHTTQVAASAAGSDTEEVDPIGEADLFLTFGRDTQAEEVLKEALNKNPNNMPVKLKLLSIYANRKDTNSFHSYASEVKESGDTAAWDEVVTMGRELDPANPLYGGSADAAAPAVESRPSNNVPAAETSPSVDFDLGFGSTGSSKSPLNQTTVVLDTPSEETTTIIPPQTSSSDMQSATMDFDITGTNPDIPVSPGSNQGEMLNLDDTMYDVTATSPRMATPEAFAAPAQDEDTMTFTLDFPSESKPQTATPARSLGLDEITLNLDQSGPIADTGASTSQDEDWQDVATKLDLAKAYQEMGDVAGAREILDEVLRDGDAQQRESAQVLMQQL